MYKFLTFLFIFFVGCSVANAATVLSLNQVTSTQENSEVGVVVLIDTDNNSINGFDISLVYDEEYLKFTGYDSSSGVNPLWVVPPKSSKNQINFSGIIPGGVSVTYDPNSSSNEKLQLVKLIFKAKKTGTTTLNVKQSSILLNDGLGTNIRHEAQDAVLNVKVNNVFELGVDQDTTPPEDLKLILIPKSKEAQTPILITFEARDESGVASYKIKNGNIWQEVTSPYAVKQKLFSHREYIRAYDVYGNFTESSLVVPPLLPYYVLIAILFVILAGFCTYKLLK